MEIHALQSELANPAREWWSALEWTREDSALAALRAEAAQGRPHRDVYDLFQEMEDKDGHYFAVLQTRKNGALARERQIVAADSTREAREAAEFVRRQFEAIPDFEQALLALLDSLAKGFAVVEILWRRAEDGALGIAGLRGRPQSLFAFAADGSLRLLSRDRFAPENAPRATGSPALPPPASGRWTPPAAAVPEAKFLVMSFGSPHGNPYGKGLALKCYWYYWFKKHNLKFWAIYNERFGAPAVIGRHGPGASEEERRRLLEVIEALQSDTGVTLPEGMTLELLEARRGGEGRTYREFADWLNDEISKIVLGATLTAAEGRRSGSLALGEVHQRVRSEYIEADARLLMEVINRRLIPWLTRFNLGPRAPLPRWEIDVQPDTDPRAEAEVDTALVRLGVPIPLAHFYRRYRRPAPAPGEPALRFDDANLYQYHLQYGVLTVNEARALLGLPPVAWGGEPPRSARAAGAGSQPAASGGRADEFPRDPAEPQDDDPETDEDSPVR